MAARWKYDLYIDGKWTRGAADQDITVIDPATEEEVGLVPEATVADARAAIEAAHRAFYDGPGPYRKPAERGAKLKRLAEILSTRKAELADIVVQEELTRIRSGKIHRLRDVNVRPNVGGKKAPGTLELHANGLRFQAARGEKLDLTFKNIKLAFFQPADKEIRVLMHFHLNDPIMIGKKKTKDVQFYVEVMEASYALDTARRSGYDPDELEEEQRERGGERRHMIE